MSTVVSTGVSAGIVGRPRIRRIASARSTSTSAAERERRRIGLVEQARYVDGRDGVGEEPLGGAPPGQRSAASAARACGRGCTAR